MVDNVILDETVSLGFTGGPAFSTIKLSQRNGQERRVPNRSLARHRYAWSLTNEQSLIDTLRSFWYDRRGDLKTWLMKDWADYSATGENIGTGDGAEVDFQIVKNYTAGVNPYVRTIRHLKSGTLSVYVNGVLQVLTTDYTVSSTGLVTFVSPPGNTLAVTADFEFYVPVRFEGDEFLTTLDYPDSFGIRSVTGLTAIEVIP